MNLARAILHLEGLAMLVTAVVAFFAFTDASPLWFIAALLVPDISIAGFLRGNRFGTVTYNLVHNYALAAALLGAGALTEVPGLTLAGILLAAHIGVDRAFGYGLKLPGSFSHTHIQHVGAHHVVPEVDAGPA
jgi:hypothetical protein